MMMTNIEEVRLVFTEPVMMANIGEVRLVYSVSDDWQI